jgi:hypothetical protein
MNTVAPPTSPAAASQRFSCSSSAKSSNARAAVSEPAANASATPMKVCGARQYAPTTLPRTSPAAETAM